MMHRFFAQYIRFFYAAVYIGTVISLLGCAFIVEGQDVGSQAQEQQFYIQGIARNETDENIVALSVFGTFQINDVINVYTNESFVKSKALNTAEDVGTKSIVVSNISLDSFFRGENNVIAKLERRGSEIQETAAYIVTIESPLRKPTVQVSEHPDNPDTFIVAVEGNFETNDSVMLYLGGTVFRTEVITEDMRSREEISFTGIQKSDLQAGNNIFTAVIQREDRKSERSSEVVLVIAKEREVPPDNQCLTYDTVPKKIINRALGKSGMLGRNIAVKGNTLVTGSGKNAAYIYESVAGIWSSPVMIADNEYIRSGSFSTAVDLYDGRTAIIGVPYAGHRGHQSGAVYIYKKTGNVWGRRVLIIPGSIEAYEGFGNAVTVNDSNLAVSSSRRDNSGAVYVYTRKNGQWVSPVLFIPSNSHEGQRFGESVSLDGTSVAIGAPGDKQDDDFSGSGAVYVYTLVGTGWDEEKVMWSNDDKEQFGSSVLLVGNTLYVGAPRYNSSIGAVHIYTRNNGSWRLRDTLEPEQTANTENRGGTRSRDLFGSALSMSNGFLFVGAPGTIANRDKVGAVFMYATEDGQASLERIIIPGETSEDEKFGSSITSDGLSLVIGAPGDSTVGRAGGAIYIVNGTYGSCDASNAEQEGQEETATDENEPIVNTVETLTKRKSVLEGLAESVTSLLKQLQMSIVRVQDQVSNTQKRVVVFDEKTITTAAQTRAAQQRGIIGPIIPDEVVVETIVLNADTSDVQTKKDIRVRDEVIDETRKEVGVVIPTTTNDLKIGDEDEEVYRLQVFLNENGYIIARSGPGSPGNETSLFGKSTERALKSFQLVNGVLTTGVLDEETRKIILTYVVDF